MQAGQARLKSTLYQQTHVPDSPDSPDSAADWQTAELPTNLKWSYVTRNVPTSAIAGVEVRADCAPRPGDVVCVKVKKIGNQARIQMRDGRRSLMYVGDTLMVVYGHRYAPDQYEAEVPPDCGPCDLVACGGIASGVISKHSTRKIATRIEPLGYAVDAQGEVLNIRSFSIESITPAGTGDKPVLGVVGTSMNAGKTTTVAALVKGLERAGLGVAAIKVTGTGAGNDMWAYADAGARLTLDFTDAGFASTYKLSASEIENCFERLVAAAQARADIDCIVVEIADGLLHPETADLVTADSFQSRCCGLLFAAGEAMGAVAGAQWLQQHRLPVLAISGVVSASALATAETERGSGLPVITKRKLESPAIGRQLLPRTELACHA